MLNLLCNQNVSDSDKKPICIDFGNVYRKYLVITKFCIITRASGALYSIMCHSLMNIHTSMRQELTQHLPAAPTEYQRVALLTYPLVFTQSEPLPDRNLLFDFNRPSVVMISMDGTPLPPLQQIKPQLKQLIGSRNVCKLKYATLLAPGKNG